VMQPLLLEDPQQQVSLPQSQLALHSLRLEGSRCKDALLKPVFSSPTMQAAYLPVYNVFKAQVSNIHL
jgi:hypothetical protein